MLNTNNYLGQSNYLVEVFFLQQCYATNNVCVPDLSTCLSRGGRYSEEDAKIVVEQILSIVSFCHLQGVVHRDLKPEVFVELQPWHCHQIYIFYYLYGAYRL